MPDIFQRRLYAVALVVAALATLGAVIYLSIRGEGVNDYLAGLAGLTIGALLPSPLQSTLGTQTVTVTNPPGQPVPVEPVHDDGAGEVRLILCVAAGVLVAVFIFLLLRAFTTL